MHRNSFEIAYSETLETSPTELIEAVREQAFKGIVAKRRELNQCQALAPQREVCLVKSMKSSKNPSRSPQVLTVREVSEYLRVHPMTIYRLVRAKQIPAFRVGGEWRFGIDSIDRWSRGESQQQ
jgi:excisionase family DNA binding protein